MSLELSVLNKEGKKTESKVKLSKEVFGIEPNNHAIYLDVKQYLANKRQGTHKAKERAEITGSTKKIKKQKGTGTARAGSIKSPIFRGGGTVFGPRVRSYSQKINKKVKVLARKSALSIKSKDNSLIVLEKLSFKKPQTKEFLSILKNIGVENKKTLFVVENENTNLYLSSRNLKKSNVIVASELNTYKILDALCIVFVGDSVKKIEEILLNN